MTFLVQSIALLGGIYLCGALAKGFIAVKHPAAYTAMEDMADRRRKLEKKAAIAATRLGIAAINALKEKKR